MELCLSTLESIVKKEYEGPKLDISMPDVLMQATCGLNYLHERNVVHRDIKPQNILISYPFNGGAQIKLSDFAISRIAKDGNFDFTMSGSQHGTQGWIAPELLKDSTKRYTDRVDIFPLGCIFCYSLTEGKHPFGKPLERHARIEQGDYKLPQELNSYECALELIKAMLDPDPTKRLSSKQVYEHSFFDVYCRHSSFGGASLVASSNRTSSSVAAAPSRSQQISELFDLAVADKEEIGRGSFNTVVRIISLEDGQKRACKRIEKKLNYTYMNEVEILKNEAFNHSNYVVRYFEWSENSAYW